MWVLFSLAAVSSYCKRLTLPLQLKVTPDGCDRKLCHGHKEEMLSPQPAAGKGMSTLLPPINCSQAGHPVGASPIE